VYIDTSVAVKLYVKEPDSRHCDEVVGKSALVSSRLLSCEFRSALMNKVRQGAISAALQDEIWSQFQSDVEGRMITLISIDDVLVSDASSLLAEMRPDIPLRTLDALHLATCLSVEAGSLFTKDLRMCHAAEHLGIPLAG
jgi:predicted nucleic acid-binding protein